MRTAAAAVVVVVDVDPNIATTTTVMNAVRSQTSALARMMMAGLVSLHLPLLLPLLLLLLESSQVSMGCSRFSSQFALKRFESTDVGLVLEWRKRE